MSKKRKCNKKRNELIKEGKKKLSDWLQDKMSNMNGSESLFELMSDAYIVGYARGWEDLREYVQKGL